MLISPDLMSSLPSIMIDYAYLDLLDASSRVVQFTPADDALWSGAVVLAPGEELALPHCARHDLLILEGLAVADGSVLERGDFAIRRGSPRLRVGPEGVHVLAFRDACSTSCEEITVPHADRPWCEGRTPGMLLANLSNASHALNLVMWQPYAITRRHAHPRGEEIFVLRGELCDEQRYPAGSWLRLHSGDWHAPHVETPTMILVRSGHLKRCGKAS